MTKISENLCKIYLIFTTPIKSRLNNNCVHILNIALNEIALFEHRQGVLYTIYRLIFMVKCLSILRYTSVPLSYLFKSSLFQPLHSCSKIAMDSAEIPWIPVCHDLAQLQPDRTMNMGQCFNWKKICISQYPSWVGVYDNKPLIIRQRESSTEFLSLLLEESHLQSRDMQGVLHDYFQLDYDLPKLYSIWSSGCDRMKTVTTCLTGVRVVRQDPWECLISFICSSNNNIARITQMLNKLRRRYGQYLCTIAYSKQCSSDPGSHRLLSIPVLGILPDAQKSDETSGYHWTLQYKPPVDTVFLPTPASADKVTSLDREERHDLYAFPTVEALATASEEDLRALGMGYRARFIIESAKIVQQKAADLASKEEDCSKGGPWFAHLRSVAAGAEIPALPQNTSPAKKPKTQKTTTTAPVASVKVEVKEEHTENIEQQTPTTAVETEQARRGRLYVQQQLMGLPGVGRKVADCVALFSLDQTAAVPVDTHVWNIAIRDYAPHLRRSFLQQAENNQTVVGEGVMASPSGKKSKRNAQEDSPFPISPPASTSATVKSPVLSSSVGRRSRTEDIETKSLTPAVYEMVGDVFRAHFGVHTGWAHSVLFAAELAEFRAQLPPQLQEEMRDFADLQRSAKKAKREEKLASSQSTVLCDENTIDASYIKKECSNDLTDEFLVEGKSPSKGKPRKAPVKRTKPS